MRRAVTASSSCRRSVRLCEPTRGDRRRRLADRAKGGRRLAARLRPRSASPSRRSSSRSAAELVLCRSGRTSLRAVSVPCPGWTGSCPRSRGCRRLPGRRRGARPAARRARRRPRPRGGGRRARGRRERGRAARRRGREHERFGTATVRAGDLTVDLADHAPRDLRRPGRAARRGAGAARRGPRAGATSRSTRWRIGSRATTSATLHDPHGGAGDLDAGVDPRAARRAASSTTPPGCCARVRYEARLGFRLDADTERLAREAAAGARCAPSPGPRIRDELLDLLARARGAAPRVDADARARARPRRCTPRCDADARAGGARRARRAPRRGADRASPRLPRWSRRTRTRLELWLDGPRPARGRARRRAARRARAAPQLAGALRGASCRRPRSTRCCAASRPRRWRWRSRWARPREPVLRFVADAARRPARDHGRRPASPPACRSRPRSAAALAETLRRKLDGEVPGRDEELTLALELARGR